MRRSAFIAKQSACPSGVFGHLLAWVMAAETARDNDITLALLELAPADHALEIGFGHGRTIARAARRVSRGFIAGVDVSSDMVRSASWVNRRLIRAGRAELRQASAGHLPYCDDRFEKVYSVHTIYFWTDLDEQLREVRRVLKTGGRFVLCFRFDEEALEKFPGPIYTFYPAQDVLDRLIKAGFVDVRIEERQFGAKRMHWIVSHSP
jgi:ubiquinone/menaquinone biosynthesis C-methylase UbiE